MLNTLFLTACVCIAIALALYFFYWNRFLASLIAQTIRILYWNQEGSSIWIEIGSIHFSLLMGRILFKDVQYHSSNQTIKFVKGQIQWRYWIRRPISEDKTNSLHGDDVLFSGRLWSCRVHFSLQGVECFLYNRTATYDDIITQMERATRPASRSSFFTRFSRQKSIDDSSQLYSSPSRTVLCMPSFVLKGLSWMRKQMPSFDSKDLLPLGIRIQKGAIILGNPSTPTLLVAEFQDATGTYGVVPSRSTFDHYKQVLNMQFQSALIRLVDNDDFVDSMTIVGGLIHSRAKSHSGGPFFYRSYPVFRRLWRQLGLERLTEDYFAMRQAQRVAHKSLASSLPGFKKSRVIEEETLTGIDFSSYEYAIERKFLEAPALEVTYYVDVVGEVPSDPSTSYSKGGLYDIGNNDTDPEWGFDVVIFGGTLQYGPWADRQRVELQRTFFPPTYQDHEVSPQLKPGNKRVWSALKVLVELRKETSLHIPFREPSKDWQWDGLVEVPHRPRKREAAFFSVTVGDRSAVSYILPMVVGQSGYAPTLEIHLDTITLTSSLNDVRLISAESSRIHGELPAPVQWNGERTWSFVIHLRHPTLYLLRDHINMFSDLGRDWLSGPPTDHEKFIPFIYDFQFDMQHYQANFYVNDHNIIDRPLIREENALLTLRGPTLKFSVTIPSDTFRPESTHIPFAVSAPRAVGNFSIPRWSTHALNAPRDGMSLFKTEAFNINGSYHFYAEVRDEYVEQFKLDFDVKNSLFWPFGWAIRYLLVLRENYFGSFTQFQTLSEYLEKRTENLPIGDPLRSKYRPEKSNMLEVEISFRAERPTLLLPTSLIGSLTHAPDDLNFPTKVVSFTVPEIQLQLRLHDYFMEMSLNYDRITASVLLDGKGQVTPTTPHEIFTIDGIDIVANRLFGPQPRTAVNLCIWEVTFGDIKASMTANQSEILLAASNAFRYNFTDIVNAPAHDFAPPLDPGATLYKVTVKSIEARWTTGQAALYLQLPKGIKFGRNDLGCRLYKRVNTLRVPIVCFKLLLTSSSKRKTWLEAAEFNADVDLDIYFTPHNHQAQTNGQLAFLNEQNKMTGRAKRLFMQLTQRCDSEPDRLVYRRGVYLPQPTLPFRTPALPIRDNKLSAHPPPIPTPVSLSDTDGEEGVSEADRDARLARTRTSTPVPQTQDDDLAMSSGDESDDADLTDRVSTEDDWSDIEESSQNDAMASLMSFYSPAVRHYTSNHLATPDFWDFPMFELKRDAAVFMRHFEDTTNAPNTPHLALHTLDEDVTERDKTTLCVKCWWATITFMPLALPALYLLEEDLQMIEPDSERIVDYLLGRCITKTLTKDSLTRSIMRIDINRITFRAVLHVPLEDGHPDILKTQQSSSLPTNLDILSIVELNAAGMSLAGTFHQTTSTITVSLGELSGFVDTSVDKRTLRSQPKSAILSVAFTSPFVRFAKHNLYADLGLISVEVGHNGPELVTAATFSLISFAHCVAKGIKEVQVVRLRKQRSIIASLLVRSKARAIVDPLSTIQPSYLVQSGDPELLRTDLSFKFLYHIRNCLPLPDLLDGSSQSPIDVKEFTSLIEARLRLLDPDSTSIDHLTSIDPSFLGKSADSGPLLPTHTISTFAMRLRSLRIAVLPPLEGPSSEVSVSEVIVDLQPRKQRLMQFNLLDLSSASQTSLRAKSSKPVRNTGIVVSIGDIDLIVVPHLMHFAQHVLRVRKQVEGSPNDYSSRRPLDSFERPTKIIYTQLIITLRRLQIQAAAENLVLIMGLRRLRTATAILAMQSKPSSTNGNVLFEELSLQARSPSTSSHSIDHDLLASLSFTKGYSSIVSRPDSRSRTNFKVVISLAGLKLHVPRSALRLYRFVEEWRADYLPGLEATLNTLLSEYRASLNPPRSPTVPQEFRSHSVIQVHGQIGKLEVSLQIMHGTWLIWEMHGSAGYIYNSGSLVLTNYSFGFQVDAMVLNVSSKPNAIDAAPRSRVKVAIPPLSVAGHADGLQIHMLVLLELMDLKVKPSHWDTLLAVQQKFGQDFNDILVLMQKTQRRAPSDQASINQALQYTAHIRMQGFRIGLVGLSSTAFLECQDINGGFTSTDGWDLSLSDLALSLAPRVSGHQTAGFNRRQRSVFVIIDAKLSGSNALGTDQNLGLSINKIQAVMQPSSIGEFGDFIDNLQTEMLERQEQRALELAAFKAKAQRFLQTFGVNVGDVQLEKSSWMDRLIVTISIRNVGIAFPLIHDEELHFARNKAKESAAVRAFLFCIKSINFMATRGETGQATMRSLSFQFVPRFRQSSADDFTAEKHKTRNCLLYPDMRARLRMSTSGRVWIKADVSGFILDIDSSIPDYIFSLIDVYRQGKERVERMSSITPRTPLSALPIMENFTPSLEKHYSAVPTSNVFGHLTFLSGKVRFYSMSASDEFKSKTPLSQIFLDIPDNHILELGAEVFNLPVVSLWVEYRATPASQKDSELDPSLLIFKTTVHSSHNTLRPSLLPFLTELVSHIETRMRKISSHFLVPPPLSGAPQDRRQEMHFVSSMQISFSLRIDKSTMELTCQPDVNVMAGLNWENGGFIVNISPGARNVFFSGGVGGLTLGLKHGFLSEDCVKLDARNVAFSVSFTKTEFVGESVNFISVILDTEFLGGVQFSRLQDILCFKAVWLDRIPVLDSQFIETNAIKLEEKPPASRGFSTDVLLRIRKISLEVDLGQSVSRLILDLSHTIFRTTVRDDHNEVFLYIANVSISAHGNISGLACVPSCVFQTIRRTEQALFEDQGKSCMLELRLTSGALIADFESDYQNLVHYRAEPLNIEVLDDWSQMQAAISDKTRPVHLTFTITCSDIVSVITVGTIPKLLSYMNKFQANLDAQRQGAFRESLTFRVAWAPKPDNPLSAVGEAMLHSARSRFKETGLSLVVRQHMRVRFDLLRLIVFPRTMKDLEIAQFSAKDVRARLDGLVVANSPFAERNLHLSFSSMVISKYNRTRAVPQRLGKLDDDGREWLVALFQDATEANIVGLPSMEMHMISEEMIAEFTRILTYDFFSQFIRRDGMKAFEDIYITLNMSLYAWLTLLRKNLSREMDQVKASEDWRLSLSPSSPGSAPGPQRKKKVPDPLPFPISEQPRLSHHSGISTSGPPLPRLSSLEGSRSVSSRETPLSPTSYIPASPSPLQFPSVRDSAESSPVLQQAPKKSVLIYKHRNRQIERLTMRQLGAATPDVMHPFFMKKAGFSLEDSLPQYVHEYATIPLEEILDVLLKLYSRQLLPIKHHSPSPDNADSLDVT